MTYKQIQLVVIAGFAIFSMFFGSGNLVFPLLIGVDALQNFTWAVAGLSITAIGVPFIGLISIVMHGGDYTSFFEKIGKIPGFYLIFITLGLMGPFGAVPRCITVAHGGMSLAFPDLSLWLFSVIFSTILALLIWRPNQIVRIIGVFLTPWKLGGLVLLIIVGLYISTPITGTGLPADASFKSGFREGYQTMDLLAAFFFSSTVMEFLRNSFKDLNDGRKLKIASAAACIIGSGLLFAVYISFVLLGAKYSQFLQSTAPEQMLMVISGHAFGNFGEMIVGFTMAVSCLATAAILVDLFATFLSQKVTKDKLDRRLSIVITLVISFAFSLFGFAGIRIWLGKILAVAYPALIVLAVTMILNKFVQFNQRVHKACFWIVVIVSLLWQII